MNSVEVIHDLGAGHWLYVIHLGGSRYGLTVYLQEEELAPPFVVAAFPSTTRRVKTLLSVLALGRPVGLPLVELVARVSERAAPSSASVSGST
jgi:hypothetical protein